jgi:hypothetical protein
MAIPVTHTIRLIELNDPSLICKFRVVCSCQWEGLAHTPQRAEMWIASHAHAQTLRGNEVIIKREPLVAGEPDAK